LLKERSGVDEKVEEPKRKIEKISYPP